MRGGGENRKWPAHTPEQTDQSPHRDLSEYSRANETVSNGEFVNSLLEQNIELLHRQGLLVTQTYEDTVRPIQQQSSPELSTALRTLETDISRLQLCVAAFKPQEAPPSPSQLPLEFADPITVEPPARLKAA